MIHFTYTRNPFTIKRNRPELPAVLVGHRISLASVVVALAAADVVVVVVVVVTTITPEEQYFYYTYRFYRLLYILCHLMHVFCI